MSITGLNPPKLVERFQTGEWDEDPVYGPCYKYIRKKQSDQFNQMEDLRLWREMTQEPSAHHGNPALKRRADAFFQGVVDALRDKKACRAHLRQLYRADDHLEKGDINFRYTLQVLIILAAVHLRENLGRKDRDTVLLRKLVIDWQDAHGETSASDDSQWDKAIKNPEIARLLVLLRS